MTQQILNWLAPPCFGAILAGIYALVRMWSEIRQISDAQDRLKADLRDTDRRLGEQDTRVQSLAVSIGRIEEGIDWIKGRLGHAFERGRSG